MISKADIKQIIDAQTKFFYTYFYTKQEIDERFYTKQELDGKFSQVLTAIYGIVKSNIARDQEAIIMAYRMKDAEDWIEEASPKLGLKLSRRHSSGGQST